MSTRTPRPAAFRAVRTLVTQEAVTAIWTPHRLHSHQDCSAKDAAARMPAEIVAKQASKPARSVSRAVAYNRARVFDAVQAIRETPPFVPFGATFQPVKIAVVDSGFAPFTHADFQSAGINIVHVAYKGAAPALQDVIGGHVQMMFATAASVIGLIRHWKLRSRIRQLEAKLQAAERPTIPPQV